MLTLLYLSLCSMFNTSCSSIHREDTIKVVIIKKSDDTQIDTKTVDSKTFKQRTKQWKEMLPLFAQKAVDLGYDLPKPFSVSIIPNYSVQTSKIDITGAHVAGHELHKGGSKVDLNGIDFSNAKSKTTALQMRLGVFIFPFLQFAFTIGRTQGHTDNLKVTINNSTFPSLMSSRATAEASCAGHHRPSAKCTLVGKLPYIGSITMPFNAEYSGTSYTESLVYAESLSNVFLVIPVVYSYSVTDTKAITAHYFMASARLGYQFDINDFNFKVYSGPAFYLVRGSADDSDYIGKNNTKILGLGYETSQENAGNGWAGVVGTAMSITKNYSFIADFVMNQYMQTYVFSLGYNY